MPLRGPGVVAALAAALTGISIGSTATAGSRAPDLELVRTEYVLRSPAFSPAARARALRFIETARPAVDAMTREQFLLCMLRIAAFADNGHDTVGGADDSWWPAARLPVRMIWFPSGWVVARSAAAHADLLGARVLSIEGRAPQDIFRQVRALWGGPDASRRWNLEFVVENAGLLQALGLARRADRLDLELRLADGRRVQRTLYFVPKSTAPAGQEPQRVWSPAPWPDEAAQHWQAARMSPTPLYLQEGARRWRIVPVPWLDALYVQMRTHLDDPDEPIADFRRDVDAAIEARRPHDLIVDLRFDTGGDIELTREWQRALVQRIPGRLYVLVGPYTFSAGIVAAAAFKHDAGVRARIVGDTVGDRMRWWSEGEDVCLPESHYCLHRTTGLWNLANGCAAEPACYGDKYAARVGDLRPDLHAPLTAASWQAGRDPGMEAIERDVRQQRSHP